MTNLDIQSFPLHAALQQRQRLKNLDRFRSADVAGGKGSAVLLATDVAARGLDIPAVDHVVHYQVPRSADTYVHRSGRTGRAGKHGVSLAVVDPSEKKLVQQIMTTLKRTDDLATLPVEFSLLDQLRRRLQLASEIDHVSHKQAKEAHDAAWLKNLAEEAGLDVDSDDDDFAGSDVEDGGGRRKKQTTKGKVNVLRKELDALLRQPLKARGVSQRYITSGGAGSEFVKDLLSNGSKSSLASSP